MTFPNNSQMQRLTEARQVSVREAFQQLIRADMEGRPTAPYAAEYYRLLADLDPEETQATQPTNPVPPLIPTAIAGYELLKAIGAYLRSG